MVYILVSAFEDGEYIFPVKLEIKEFNDKPNSLYVAVALEGIKKEEVLEARDINDVAQASRSSTISLTDLFKNVNKSDKNFVKYIPKQFFDGTDTDNSSDESMLTDLKVQKAKADPVRDSVFELSGKKHYTPEQLKIMAVARKFGRKVIFEETVKEQGFKSNGYYDKEGNIHLDYKPRRPLEWVLKHELTHFGEGTVEYDRCVAVLRKTKEYTRWLQKELKTNEKSLPLLEHAMREKYIAERERARTKARERGFTVPPPLDSNEAYNDIIADFLATFAFAKDSRGIEALTADMSLKEHNVFMQWLIDAISYLKKKLGGSNKTLTYELSVLEDRYLRMLTYKAQNPTTEKESGNKYSIVALENGNLYVSASRRVIAGNDISNWRSQITDFFKTLLDNNESLEIQTVEGDTLTITMSETAHKARDNYKQVSGKPVRMTDNEFKVKLNVEAHIDEIAEISKKNKNSATPDSKNHGFAKDGFTYRTAYFEDFDGQYYKITLSIGENNNIATVYNVGRIKKEALPSAKIIAVVGSKALGNTSNNNVPQSEPVVNNNSMQESEENSQENISEGKNNGNKYSLSVENENEGLYNNWESYELTDEFIQKVPSSERHTFLRSLANKTNGIKQGEHKNIIIVTGQHVYFYEATGYMNGNIVNRSRLTKKVLAEFKLRGDFYGSANTGSTTPDKMAEGYEGGKGRNEWDNDATEDRKTKGQNDDVDEQASGSDTLGDIGESNGDFTAEGLIPGSVVYDGVNAFKVNEDGTVEAITFANQNSEELNSDNNSKIQYSIPTEADELLDRYESGEISREEFMSEVDELYTQSVNDFGHLRKGERPKNAIKVPQRVEKDKKTHRFVRTIIEKSDENFLIAFNFIQLPLQPYGQWQ